MHLQHWPGVRQPLTVAPALQDFGIPLRACMNYRKVEKLLRPRSPRPSPAEHNWMLGKAVAGKDEPVRNLGKLVKVLG